MSNLDVLYLLIVRADAYDVCGYHAKPWRGLTTGGVQSSELLKAIAELPQTPAQYRPHLRSLAAFSASRFELIAANAKLTNGVHLKCDAAAIATHAPAAEKALQTRRVGRVTLAVHGVLLWRARCASDGAATVVAELQALIALQVADFEMYELLGDTQKALAAAKGKDSALMAALRAYQSAYRLAPTTAMLDIWRLKGKMDALEALLGKKRSERARGTPPSSSPGGGGGRGGGFRTPPPPAAAAAHSEGTADGGGACNEKPLPGDAFTLLGLDIRTCTKLDVKKSYRQRAREYHPDKYKGVKRCAEMHFIRLKDAYDTTLGKCQ